MYQSNYRFLGRVRAPNALKVAPSSESSSTTAAARLFALPAATDPCVVPPWVAVDRNVAGPSSSDPGTSTSRSEPNSPAPAPAFSSTSSISESMNSGCFWVPLADRCEIDALLGWDFFGWLFFLLAGFEGAVIIESSSESSSSATGLGRLFELRWVERCVVLFSGSDSSALGCSECAREYGWEVGGACDPPFQYSAAERVSFNVWVRTKQTVRTRTNPEISLFLDDKLHRLPLLPRVFLWQSQHAGPEKVSPIDKYLPA